MRLFVFDLDGTLVDSRRDIAESANAVLLECGCTPHDEETIAGMVGDGAAMLVRRAFAAAHCAPPPDALERFLRIYDARLLRHTRPYDGIRELLSQLATRGELAVLTNKPLGATHAILDGLNLSAYFQGRVLGGDGPRPRKPDPAGLLDLIARARVDARETLMVGDSIVDLRTARGAGTRACVARYGFGFRPEAQDAVHPEDLFIERPLDLLDHL